MELPQTQSSLPPDQGLDELIPMRYNPLDNTWKPTDGIYFDQMFFRWRISVERVEE